MTIFTGDPVVTGAGDALIVHLLIFACSPLLWSVLDEPGVRTIWWGMQRVMDFATRVRFMHDSYAATCV